MARRRKTGLPAEVWRHVFGAIAKYCARLHRESGVPMNQCVKDTWARFRNPDGSINYAALISFLESNGLLPPEVIAKLKGYATAA